MAFFVFCCVLLNFSGIFKVVASIMIFIVLGVFHEGLVLSCIFLFATVSGKGNNPRSYLRTSCIFLILHATMARVI